MFQFPKLHSFPPFYTKQSNATILENQLNEWCTLVLSYCQFHRIYSLSPQGALLSRQARQPPPPSPFENTDIGRKVGPEFLRDILNHLIHKLGRAGYVQGKNPDAGILVYWRTLDEWAQLLHEHVSATGQLGDVLTVYELTQSEDSPVHDDLRDIDQALFVKVLEVLCKQGRAQMLKADDNPAEIGGVKIV